MKVYYNNYTGDIPIMFVERFEEFAHSIGVKNLSEMRQSTVGENTNFNFMRTIRFEGSPLKFIVFEDRMLRTVFGGRNPNIINSLLSMYVSEQKFPNNRKMQLENSLKMAIKEEDLGTYRLLRKYYMSEYGSEPPTDFYADESYIVESRSTITNFAKRFGLQSLKNGYYANKNGVIVAKSITDKNTGQQKLVKLDHDETRFANKKYGKGEIPIKQHVEEDESQVTNNMPMAPKQRRTPEVMKMEKQAHQQIHNLIRQAGPPITVIIGDKAFKNIIGAVRMKDLSKADIILMDANKRPAVYISHKGDTDAQNQLAGFGNKSVGLDKHPEVIQFLNDVAQYVKKSGGKLPEKLSKKIHDQGLMGKAIFGPDFGSGMPGPQNCQLLAKGDPQLQKTNSPGVYKLTFSGLNITPKQLGELIGTEYEPVLSVSYRPERRIKLPTGQYLNNLRGGIYSMGEVNNSQMIGEEIRKNMPQVTQKELPNALRLLNKDGISCEQVKTQISKLKPYQKDYNKDKLISMIKDFKSIEDIPPIVISSDNYIVDGHHRFLAAKAKYPNDYISTIKIDLPSEKAVEKYKEVEDNI